MAQKGSPKRMQMATAWTNVPTSALNQRLMLNHNHIKGFNSEDIRGLIRIYNAGGFQDGRAGDIFYDIIFLAPVTICHFTQSQLSSHQSRSRSLPFREWWVAFHICMGQMFDKTRDQMNNWRWDNHQVFRDQVDLSNQETTNSGMVKRTGEHFSWYSCNDLKVMIEPPSCGQYKPGNFLAGRQLNWAEIIVEDDDNQNGEDDGAPCGGRSHPGDGNGHHKGDGEEDTLGSERGSGIQNGTKDGRRTGKGKGKRNGIRKGIVKHTPAGDNISRAIALQLQMAMYEADSDPEG